MAHQFWISSYHPHGSKHNSGGDETPPITEEEIDKQKIDHETQVQKDRERQAREEQQDRELDRELLYQRQIEAREEQKREQLAAEQAEESPTMHSSWSQHRLCDIHHGSAAQRWRHGRSSVPEVCKTVRLPKSPSINSSSNVHDSTSSVVGNGSNLNMADTDGIVVNFNRSRRDSNYDDDQHEHDGRTLTRQQSNHLPTPPCNRMCDHRRPAVCPCCRAPIASLDCMDDFSANSHQAVDQGRHVSTYMGNHTTMPTVITPGLCYKNLGKSGLRVPNVGLGIWSIFSPDIPEKVSEEMINIALDSGINLLDLSEAHSVAKAEVELGRILQKRNVKRASIIISTKIYWSTKSDERGLSRKHIVESVKSSLERLQVEYIDIVLLHKVDPMCPMEELVRAMSFLITKGWVMYWGTARWSPNEISDAFSNCRQFNCFTPIVEQTEYHMFCREKAELYMPELYNRIGVGLMVWSAITTGKGLTREEVTGLFARSRFNRKYSTFSWCEEEVTAVAPTESGLSGSKEQMQAEEARTYGDKLNDLTNLAESLNCSISQLAVAWCLKNEMVNCLLLGAVSPTQLKENIHSLQIVPQLTIGVMADIEKILENKPIRPPMVSTLALRSQMQQLQAQQAGAVVVDIPSGGSATGGDSPKVTVVETPTKESSSRSFCEIQ